MPALRTTAVLLAVALAALASGCASTTPKYVRAPSLAPPEPDPQDSRNAYLELIERMQQQGAWYASLAHVEAFRQRYGDRPALRLLQADACARPASPTPQPRCTASCPADRRRPPPRMGWA